MPPAAAAASSRGFSVKRSSISFAALAAMNEVPSVVPAFNKPAPKPPAPEPPAVTLLGGAFLGGAGLGLGGTVLGAALAVTLGGILIYYIFSPCTV